MPMWGRLTTTERQARRALLELLLTGTRDPGATTLAARLGVSAAQAGRVLAALERKGFLVQARRATRIRAAYPLSSRPTRHRILLKETGQRGYALCAIDALGVGSLFGTAVVVTSSCPHCRRPIRVHVEGNRVTAAKPAGVAVWYTLSDLLTGQRPNANLSEAH
jgi:hypothetical protein